MPILVMGLLALAVFGLIGILLIVAVILEHSTLSRAAKTDTSHPATSGALLTINQNDRRADAPPGNPSPKEKVHEHACTG